MKGYNHGKLISEETRKKMSESSKRTRNGFKKGHKTFILKHSDDTKKKMSAYAIKIGRKPKQPKGYKHSPETIIKLSESHKGEKNINWKGGIVPINKKIRNSMEYKLWRKSVLERDDYTCQNCNQHGGELRAHHINNFAEKEELRFSLDNGIIFCKDCHVEFHSLYGNRNNTKEQLLEFLGN